MRLRLDIAYDGTDFHGWAVQPGRRTVAGVLGEALATLFRAPVPLVVAGRTDAGVHATGQVAHVDVDRVALAGLAPRHLIGRDAADPVTGMVAENRAAAPSTDTADLLAATPAGLVGLRRRLAGLLPPDVRVPGVSVAPDGFDARFSALRRHYRYRVASSEWGVAPLRRFDTLAWRRPLDVAAMQDAADALTGLRDFAAYCKPREGATTIRDLQRLRVTGRRQQPPSPPPGRSPHRGDGNAGPAADPGDLVVIDVTAGAFCHSMVRSLVGALLAVGDGRFPVDRPAALLAAGRRTAEIAVAPAHGLTLIGVDYPTGAELAARAVQTRAVRGTGAPEAR
jgi:tRNA pseudouridine38-40 synthase